MNLTLKKPDLEHYSNGNHLEFHETLYRIFDKHKEVIDAPLLLSAYQDKVQQENNSFNRLRSSELTEKKAETDYRRDRVLAQLIGVLRPLGKHFNPAIRNQARHVLALIRNYVDLVHTHYDAAAMRDITNRITNRITALIDLNGNAAFTALVKEFNVHVEHYNTLLHEHYGRLHAKVDLSSGNNVEPGTATLIITGIGRYRGERTTRFNIRREREMTGRA